MTETLIENEILFTCGEHGELTREGVNKNGNKWRCKACFKRIRDTHYAKNKKDILAKQKTWRDENPELRKKIKYESWLKNKDKYAEKKLEKDRRYVRNNIEKVRARDNAKKKRYRETLHPVYIRDHLTRRTALSASEIPDELMRLARAAMILKRLSKEELQ